MKRFKLYALVVVATSFLSAMGLGQKVKPAQLECDPAEALSSPPQGFCHYGCGANTCGAVTDQENVHPGDCVTGETRCRLKSQPTELTLYWYDCVQNGNEGCTGSEVHCKWQVNSGSGHNALVIDCENY